MRSGKGGKGARVRTLVCAILLHITWNIYSLFQPLDSLLSLLISVQIPLCHSLWPYQRTPSGCLSFCRDKFNRSQWAAQRADDKVVSLPYFDTQLLKELSPKLGARHWTFQNKSRPVWCFSPLSCCPSVLRLTKQGLFYPGRSLHF